MIVHEPTTGSFSHFAYKYWGNFPGFLTGWNYWILYILVAMSELTAVAKYINYWWPFIPAWVSVLFFFIVITLVNLGNVKFYGESEFWLAIIKVTAVIAMIIFGIVLLVTADPSSGSTITNLWTHGGFFPKGFSGLFYMLAFIMFAFGGIELIGMAAAEAEQPEKPFRKRLIRWFSVF
jgi:AAT family amino acid transporter/aromatic amino acid transport protein AroP